MTPIARAGPDPSQGPESLLDDPCGCKAQTLEPCSAAFSGTYIGSWIGNGGVRT